MESHRQVASTSSESWCMCERSFNIPTTSGLLGVTKRQVNTYITSPRPSWMRSWHFFMVFYFIYTAFSFLWLVVLHSFICFVQLIGEVALSMHILEFMLWIAERNTIFYVINHIQWNVKLTLSRKKGQKRFKDVPIALFRHPAITTPCWPAVPTPRCSNIPLFRHYILFNMNRSDLWWRS